MQGDITTLVETAIQAASAYGRDDLSHRLARTRQRLSDPTVRVMIVGEFKQGKSSLVNALLNAQVCPVDDDVATSVPTLVRHAAEPYAGVVRRSDEGVARMEAIDFGSLPIYASEIGNPGNERGLHAVEIGLPRRLLSQGLELVDTPGVGGLGSTHTSATISALPSADMVLFVSDASQEMTGPELEFLQLAKEVGAVIAFVLTKTDFYPDWRRIRDINSGHLSTLGVEIPIFATSALLRTKAIESEDKPLNIESGYPHLIEFIESNADRAASTATASLVGDLRSAVGQMLNTFETEKQILDDPERAEAIMAEFQQAKERADALRDLAARWNVTLNDGVADLNADFDHRLRGRLRQTTIDAEAAIEDQDPGEIWDEFAAWLGQRVSYDLAQTYLELSRRTQELSRLVAEHFDDGKPTFEIHLHAGQALSLAADVDPRMSVEAGKVDVGTKAMTAMRGSYGGLLMFGMVAQMAGLAMLNPATAVIGVLMGRKAVKDDRERQLTVRRQQAKITSRQFVDDTGFEVGKELKDSLRTVHRQLRDHYQNRAEELKRSIAEALGAAKTALNSDQQKRGNRLRDVNAEIGRLQHLMNQIDELSHLSTKATPAAAATPTAAKTLETSNG